MGPAARLGFSSDRRPPPAPPAVAPPAPTSLAMAASRVMRLGMAVGQKAPPQRTRPPIRAAGPSDAVITAFRLGGDVTGANRAKS